MRLTCYRKSKLPCRNQQQEGRKSNLRFRAQVRFWLHVCMCIGSYSEVTNHSIVTPNLSCRLFSFSVLERYSLLYRVSLVSQARDRYIYTYFPSPLRFYMYWRQVAVWLVRLECHVESSVPALACMHVENRLPSTWAQSSYDSACSCCAYVCTLHQICATSGEPQILTSLCIVSSLKYMLWQKKARSEWINIGYGDLKVSYSYSSYSHPLGVMKGTCHILC